MGAMSMALILLGVSVWNLYRQGFIGSRGGADAIVEEGEKMFLHPLTGEKTGAEVARPMVYAVMVENSADAWPQSGVDQAFEVMEAPAEGGIPRLLALYAADATVDKIGPVRSARPYYIDWASAYGALYAHVGGSPEALETLKTTDDVYDLNEFFNQYQFWRAPDRAAPHNVYTSTDLLARGLHLRYAEVSVPDYGLMTFKDDAALEERPTEVEDFTVEMGASLYRAVWKYDRETNTYSRYENTDAQLMADGTPIQAHVIAVIATNMTVLDAIGRLSIDTIGEGDGLLLQDGIVKKMTWKKPTATDVLRYYDEQGVEIALNAGQRWVEVVESL